MTINHELEAIGKTYEIISRLSHPQQKRVLNWLESKIEETKPGENQGEEGIEGIDYAIHTGYDAIQEGGIGQYKNLRNLLDDINIKSSSDKTLLTAAFMKSNRNMEQFKARDISNTLKEIGESVPNITLAVQQLIKKELIQYIKGAKKGKRLEKKLEFTEFGDEIVRRAVENKELMLRRLR
ncbi:hypothetical protein [Membranihabitans maritimus]|uniref:hypothetical protein n=1 Tax=Membranihabitans maritimus TaxID=2904244 RepID=UPI001F3B7940|nr:hypothetical protein [Membranihabitans maritimus]